MKCVTCKKGTMRRAKVRTSLEVDGHRFTGTVPGSACDACGDDQIAGPETQAFERAVARKLVGGAPRGDAIKFVRKALCLNGEALGALLGVRFETVSRWERGLHPIDRQSWALLGLLVSDRARTEAALRAAAEPAKLSREIVVKVA